MQKQIGGNMLAEKIVELEMNDSLESLREGGIESGPGINIIYTMQPKRLFFSGLLKSGKAKSVNGFSSEESKKFLFRKLFNLWSHLKNNQVKNFISELRSPTFIGAIRSWNHSLESGVVS